jgi:hypothetical protein
MSKRHKHYDEIVAWANGKKIQYKFDGDAIWRDWCSNEAPSFMDYSYFRIKPEPTPDVVKEWRTNRYGKCVVSGNPNIRLTFSGEDGRLIKAEVIGD